MPDLNLCTNFPARSKKSTISTEKTEKDEVERKIMYVKTKCEKAMKYSLPSTQVKHSGRDEKNIFFPHTEKFHIFIHIRLLL